MTTPTRCEHDARPMTRVWECVCGMWNSGGDKVCPLCGLPKRKTR